MDKDYLAAVSKSSGGSIKLGSTLLHEIMHIAAANGEFGDCFEVVELYPKCQKLAEVAAAYQTIKKLCKQWCKETDEKKKDDLAKSIKQERDCLKKKLSGAEKQKKPCPVCLALPSIADHPGQGQPVCSPCSEG